MIKKLLVACVTAVVAVSAMAQKINVVTEEYPPFNFMGPDKKITGFSTEVVEDVLKRAKIDYSLEMLPWARAYKMAQEEPNVLIYSIGRTAQRENLFKWVDVIAPYNVFLYKMKGKNDIVAKDIAALKNFKVGGVRDDVRAQVLEKEGVKMDLVADDAANLKKLEAGRIDMFPIDEGGMVALLQREGRDPANFEKVIKIDSLSSGLYMAFSKQTSDEVVARAKKALQDAGKDGTLDKIKAKYLK